MLKYKAIITDKDDFNSKIIQPIKDNLKGGNDIGWLKDADKFYGIDMLSYIIKNAYNERYIRYDTEEEFIGYFSNIFLTVTPMFYAKVSNIIEDKLKELQVNSNVGKKTNVTSKSNRGSSGRAFDNTIGSGKQTSTEESDYTMDSRTDNILDNAKKLSQSKISGEVTLYVASFAELFTTLDIEGEVDKEITPALLAIISDIAVAVTTLGKIEVSDNGIDTKLIEFTGQLLSKAESDTGLLRVLNEAKAYADAIPQSIVDLTHLKTQGDVYNNVNIGNIVIVKPNNSNTPLIVTCYNKNPATLYLSGMYNNGGTAYNIVININANSISIFNFNLQYLSSVSPKQDNEVATKKYVDDNVGSFPKPVIHKDIFISLGDPISLEIINALNRGDIVTVDTNEYSGAPVYDKNSSLVCGDGTNIVGVSIKTLFIGQLYA